MIGSFMSWKDDILVFDTETTGFKEDARILQIGMVHLVNQKVHFKFSMLAHPGPIDWNSCEVTKALSVNKITRKDVVDLPTLKDMSLIINYLMQPSTWAAHNAEFDHRMLKQSMSPIAPPLLIVDTLICDYGLRPGKHKRSLENVCREWKVVNENPHEAFGDALATAEVLVKMLPSLPDNLLEMMNLMRRWGAQRKREIELRKNKK